METVKEEENVEVEKPKEEEKQKEEAKEEEKEGEDPKEEVNSSSEESGGGLIEEKVVKKRRKSTTSKKKKALNSFRSVQLTEELTSYGAVIKHLLEAGKLLAVKMTPAVSKKLTHDTREYTIDDPPVTVHSLALDKSPITKLEDGFFDECVFKKAPTGNTHEFTDPKGQKFECKMKDGVLTISLSV